MTRTRLQLGDLELASRFVLAPLAGYTTLAFRLVVRELGGIGLATTDLVNARALLVRSRRTMELIQTCSEDRPLAVQIYGSVPEEMAEAARWLESYGVSSVDINMGCPVHKVCRGGGGSAMMCDPAKTVALVRTVVEAVRIPVTVKMRLGWDESDLSAPFFAREFEQAGNAVGDKWTPAITVPQIRWAIALLLHRSLGCDKPARIRRTRTRRLKRNEQARLYHWKSRKRVAPKRVQQTE